MDPADVHRWEDEGGSVPSGQEDDPADPLIPHGIETYVEDGRKPLAELYRSYLRLRDEFGWHAEVVCEQERTMGDGSVRIPILCLRTPHEGSALWVLSGIHGEEPAGPNAIAANVDTLDRVARSGVPMVLLPLCNPKGYSLNWRYPNTADRNFRGEGMSVGDSDHLLPDFTDPTTVRVEQPSSADALAFTAVVLRCSEKYPPALVLDHHEDELAGAAYVYGMGHPPSFASTVASEVLKALGRPSMAIVQHGVTRFGEEIVEGQAVFQPEAFRDGSIDELLWSEDIIVQGVKTKGPRARVVLTVETPAFDIPLVQRIAAHGAVIQSLPKLWEMVHRSVVPSHHSDYEELFRGLH